jgi:hypothetical protein
MLEIDKSLNNLANMNKISELINAKDWINNKIYYPYLITK